jgi:hypothetical protein
MLSFTDLTNKAVRLSRDTSSGTLTQLQQDINQGYQLFNAKLSRYFSRKQQFTDLIDGQQIYQTPVDCVRVIGMTATTSTGSSYQPPIKEIRSEFEWRQINAPTNYSSSWISYYFMIGNDEVALWPIPSADVTNGLRFYYQVQDPFLSVEDIVSSELSPTQTCTITNGSATVTSTGTTFTAQLKGLWFQLTGVTNTTWYEIVDVPTSSTLTLKSAFVGISGASQNFRIGQMPIIPQEYHDALVHYALWLFFSGKSNEERAGFHKKIFDSTVDDAVQEYSSSTEGNVIFDDGTSLNSWFLTPLPPVGS